MSDETTTDNANVDQPEGAEAQASSGAEAAAEPQPAPDAAASAEAQAPQGGSDETAGTQAQPSGDVQTSGASEAPASAEELEAAMADLQAQDEQAAAQAGAEALRKVASEAAEAATGGSAVCGAEATPFEPPDLTAAQAKPVVGDIGMLDDVELDVRIELGRTEMYIEDVLRLRVGSVVELDKNAGDPVDIYVNDRLVARGEVLVLNDAFCVRINDIVSPIPELEAS